MAAETWISILPRVFDLLLNGADRIVDDTSIERLLVWLEDVCSTSEGLKMLLQQETGVPTFLSSKKLVDEKPCCIGVSFALRLSGILWSKDYNVNDSSTFIDLFAKSRENESLWNEAIVRHGYFSGLQSLTASVEGRNWLQKHKECLVTAYGCISDSSMFVALAARELIANFIISSWSINISEQNSGYSSEIRWLLELLQEKLCHDNLPASDSNHQRMISDLVVSVLDIVRILLNTNFEVGQEIVCVSKLFANCVTTAAEMDDQTVCRKLVDVINGFQLNPRSQYSIDWDKLLSCVGENQIERSAQTILLTIPMKWYKKGMITLALDFIAGLSLPKDTVSRCFTACWPEILACLINAPFEVLMEKHVGNNCNGYGETNTSDIDCLVEDLLSLGKDDLDTNIKRVKKEIQELLEPWMLMRKFQVVGLLQILYTIKNLVAKDATSYSQHLEQWIECSVKILVNSSMVSNGDQNVLALDVKGNVKVIKTTLSIVTILLQQLLHLPNLTDSNRKQFFRVLNTAILIARSPRTDPTVMTSTLECIGVLLDQASFLLMPPSTNQDSSGAFPAYYQRIKEDLGSLIHLRLRDQRWEVKDSALEFVGRLIKLNPAFLVDVINPSILSLVWESVDDSESYVRSSAWCCIGHLACNPGLWTKLKEKEHLTEFAVLKKMVHVLENDSEAFPRRSVMDCLISWSRDQHPIVSAVFPKPDQKSEILDPMISSSTGLAEPKDIAPEMRSVFSEQHPNVNAVLPKPDQKSEILDPKISSSTGLAEPKDIAPEMRSVFSEQHPNVNAVLPKPDQKSEIEDPKISLPTVQAEPKNTDSETRSLFSEIIRFAFKDFDWEVKIRALQLVETIIQIYSDFRESTEVEDSCSEPSPSQQCQSHNNLISLLVDLGAAVPLLEAVIDCDSLVCEKALKVISTLRGLIHSEITDISLPGSNETGSEFQPIRNENLCDSLEEHPDKSKENNQPIVTPEEVQDVIETSKVFSVETFNVILCRLDVSSLATLCTASDINVQKDPAGFLEDILVAARDHGDNLLDCY